MPAPVKKNLIIPIISPIYNKESRRWVIRIDKDAVWEGSSHFINTDVLVFLKNSLEEADYDGILVAGTAGEGDKIDFELWKQLVYASISVFDHSKLIIGILFKKENEIDDALNYLYKHYSQEIKSVLVKIPEDHEKYASRKFIEFYKKIFTKDLNYWMYFTKEHNWVTNDMIRSVLKDSKIGARITGIKDARKGKENPLDASNIINLAQSSECKDKVFEGWEDRYNHSKKFVAGGVFPIANVEPKFTRELINSNIADSSFSEAVINAMLRRYGEGENWQAKLKETLYHRPVSLRYDYRDFSKAWDVFFKFYSEEPIDNIHVNKFDPEQPLPSMMRTFISDMLSF